MSLEFGLRTCFVSIELLQVPTVEQFCSAAMCLEVQADMRLLAAGQIRPNPKEILNIKPKKYALESFIPDS